VLWCRVCVVVVRVVVGGGGKTPNELDGNNNTCSVVTEYMMKLSAIETQGEMCVIESDRH
jgi:hypothetical protein